jgi:hypothetical protein
MSNPLPAGVLLVSGSHARRPTMMVMLVMMGILSRSAGPLPARRHRPGDTRTGSARRLAPANSAGSGWCGRTGAARPRPRSAAGYAFPPGYLTGKPSHHAPL